MPALRPPAGLNESDFERIEAAVMETERGRWFLAELGRRTREQATQLLLKRLDRIEAILREGAGENAGQADAELISRAQESAERLQDIVWSLREAGFDERVCQAISDEASRLAGFAPSRTSPPQATPEGSMAEPAAPAPQPPATPVEAVPVVASAPPSAAMPQSTPHQPAAPRARLPQIPPARAPAPRLAPLAALPSLPDPEAARRGRREAFAPLAALSFHERLAFFA